MDIQITTPGGFPIAGEQTSFERERSSLEILMDQVALAGGADLARAGRYLEAESLLLEMTRRQQPVPAALDLLACIYAQQARLAEAIALWQSAIQRQPGNPAFAAALQRATALQRSVTWLPCRRIVVFGLALVLLLALVSLLALWQFTDLLAMPSAATAPRPGPAD